MSFSSDRLGTSTVPLYFTPVFDSPVKQKVIDRTVIKPCQQKKEKAETLLTSPGGLQVPFVKKYKFAFAVVNRGFSLHFADFRHLTAALLVLHFQSKHQGF